MKQDLFLCYFLRNYYDREAERQRKREWAFFCWFGLQTPTRAGLGQTKVEAWIPIWVFLCHLLPRKIDISGKAQWKVAGFQIRYSHRICQHSKQALIPSAHLRILKVGYHQSGLARFSRRMYWWEILHLKVRKYWPIFWQSSVRFSDSALDPSEHVQSGLGWLHEQSRMDPRDCKPFSRSHGPWPVF